MDMLILTMPRDLGQNKADFTEYSVLVLRTPYLCMYAYIHTKSTPASGRRRPSNTGGLRSWLLRILLISASAFYSGSVNPGLGTPDRHPLLYRTHVAGAANTPSVICPPAFGAQKLVVVIATVYGVRIENARGNFSAYAGCMRPHNTQNF